MKFKRILNIINSSNVKKYYPEIYEAYMPGITEISKAFSGTVKSNDLAELDFGSYPLNKFRNRTDFENWIKPGRIENVTKQQKEKEIAACLQKILDSLKRFRSKNQDLEKAQKGRRHKTKIWSVASAIITIVFGSLSGFMVDALTGGWNDPLVIVFLVMTLIGVLLEIFSVVRSAVKKNEMYEHKNDPDFKQKYFRYINIIIGSGNTIVQNYYDVRSSSDDE